MQNKGFVPNGFYANTLFGGIREISARGEISKGAQKPEQVDPKLKTRPDWAQPVLTCQTGPLVQEKQGLKAQFATFAELAKPRLTFLVVLSTMSAYALAPGELSVLQLVVLTLGTGLCSASANAINMGREPEFDKQMTRTCTRPVASGKLTSREAFGFSAVTGAAGIALLQTINPTVSALGAANIVLYGGVYTSLKRKHIANTWVGAVVGAIPPLMGWGACASLADPGAWMLAALLYSWQFPHFMSLSYSIADEYKRAGYVMSAWTNPLLTARVALRHAIAMFPICFGLSWFGVCDPYFCIDSSIVNAWLVYTSFRFWQQQRLLAKGLVQPTHSGEKKKYARQLFWASVIHLPVVLILAMVHKEGQWDWLFDSFT